MEQAEDIKVVALQRFIKQMNTLGAQVKVVFGGEVLHDDILESKQKRAPRRDLNGMIGYTTVLQEMQPGDSRLFSAPEGFTDSELQSTLCANARQRWGLGAYISHKRLDGGVEILRLE